MVVAKSWIYSSIFLSFLLSSILIHFLFYDFNVLILNLCSASVDKLERIIIPAAVDSTQQEALSVLKKLKVCFLKHGLCVGVCEYKRLVFLKTHCVNFLLNYSMAVFESLYFVSHCLSI